MRRWRPVYRTGAGHVLELGSGAGFLSDMMPDLITSEIFWCEHIQVVIDGRRCARGRDGTLRAILMTDVLHHVPDVRAFFTEAARCVRPGGVVAMIEPWVSRWSRLIYTRFHHEPFRPQYTRLGVSGPWTALQRQWRTSLDCV